VKPIIFNSESIRAILDGRKTMTRRVVKHRIGFDIAKFQDGTRWPIGWQDYDCIHEDNYMKCPYSDTDQLLWVRETWAIRGCGGKVPLKYWTEWPVDRVQYIATDKAPATDKKGCPYWWNKRSSIFMPKWASRVTLEITHIRVERVQEITAEDCISEGLSSSLRGQDAVNHLKARFKMLWSFINGKKPGCSWEDNPWVWVVEFKVESTKGGT